MSNASDKVFVIPRLPCGPLFVKSRRWSVRQKKKITFVNDLDHSKFVAISQNPFSFKIRRKDSLEYDKTLKYEE